MFFQEGSQLHEFASSSLHTIRTSCEKDCCCQKSCVAHVQGVDGRPLWVLKKRRFVSELLNESSGTAGFTPLQLLEIRSRCFSFLTDGLCWDCWFIHGLRCSPVHQFEHTVACLAFRAKLIRLRIFQVGCMVDGCPTCLRFCCGNPRVPE